MNNQTPTVDRTVREHECRQLTGLARTTRYQLEKQGKFPARRNLGGRAIGWKLSEIQAWLDECFSATTGKNSGKGA